MGRMVNLNPRVTGGQVGRVISGSFLRGIVEPGGGGSLAASRGRRGHPFGRGGRGVPREGGRASRVYLSGSHSRALRDSRLKPEKNFRTHPGPGRAENPLPVVGQFAQAIVAEEVKGNRFTIKTIAPGVKVSWQVNGILEESWANY